MIVVADTGALYALADRSDDWHARVVTWWQHAAATSIVVPVTVVPEVTYLLGRRIGRDAESAFVESIANAELTLEPVEADDVAVSLEVMRRYQDLDVGFTDASVVAVADRLGTRAILTTDRRHFGVMRSTSGRAFRLLP